MIATGTEQLLARLNRPDAEVHALVLILATRGGASATAPSCCESDENARPRGFDSRD